MPRETEKPPFTMSDEKPTDGTSTLRKCIAKFGDLAKSDANTCGRRTGTVVPRAENFGDLLTAIHKVHSESCDSRNNHRCAVVVQDLATQWTQPYHCKTKLHRKLKEACKSSWSPIGSLKSFTLTIPWNLVKLVKIFPGIIVRQHRTDRKQM